MLLDSETGMVWLLWAKPTMLPLPSLPILRAAIPAPQAWGPYRTIVRASCVEQTWAGLSGGHLPALQPARLSLVR